MIPAHSSPVSAVSPSRRAITAMILCFTAQAVGCLIDEMPFFAVTIRWMALPKALPKRLCVIERSYS